MTNKLFAASFALLVIGFAACKKDSTPPPATPTTSNLSISWGFHWGNPDFMLDSMYTDGFGHAIRIHKLRYLVSDLQFKHGTSVVGDFHNTRLLLDAAEEGVAALGAIAPTTIDSLTLTLGLDSALNHGDPATASAPLNDTTMHWGPGTANGYYFLEIEGQVDGNADGVVNASDPVFTYRCATDALRRRITKAGSYPVTAGTATIPHMHLHVNELLAGIDILNNLTAIGAHPINVQLMDQLVTVIELE